MFQAIQETRESLLPMFLFQALRVLKETREMLGGLETREFRGLKAKKDKEELELLEWSMCAGEGPRVLMILR